MARPSRGALRGMLRGSGASHDRGRWHFAGAALGLARLLASGAASAPGSAGGAAAPGAAVPASSGAALPEGCDTEAWRFFLGQTMRLCTRSAPWLCMYHILFRETAWEAVASSIFDFPETASGPSFPRVPPTLDTASAPVCREGLGAAAVIYLRDLESWHEDTDFVPRVDLQVAKDGAEAILLDLGQRTHVIPFSLDFSFAPFPFTAASLLPYRARTPLAMDQLLTFVAETLTAFDIPFWPWLGAFRYWRDGRTLRLPLRGPVADLLVPHWAEAALRQLRLVFAAPERHPRDRLYLFDVHPQRLFQFSLNALPEFADRSDITSLCPRCSVINVYFLREEDGALTTGAPPCHLGALDFERLQAIRDFEYWSPEPKQLPAFAQDMLRDYEATYFAETLRPPCALTHAEVPDPAEPAGLGSASAKVLGPWEEVTSDSAVAGAAGGRFCRAVTGDGIWESVEERPAFGDRGCATPPLVLPVMDFFQEAERAASEGAGGWFAYNEARMRARRPLLGVFQMKVMMKKLMLERGVPIPTLIHASMDSPTLPFGSTLPFFPDGFVVKPAHLSESSYVFVLSGDGTNLLSGTKPTLEEIQGNMSEAWGLSVENLDRPQEESGEACSRSKRYANYLQGRSCENWALYHVPPGLIVEHLVSPSELYGNLQEQYLQHRMSDVRFTDQPDELKCHVVWGRLFVAEWVSAGMFLGYVFRHGFVKDNLALTPNYMKVCWGGEMFPLPGVELTCPFFQMWERAVLAAERAVPPGVDYLRVDIFPNGVEPVVNELSVAGYSTMMEEWMLGELMRRIRQGYAWRGFGGVGPSGSAGDPP